MTNPITTCNAFQAIIPVRVSYAPVPLLQILSANQYELRFFAHRTAPYIIACEETHELLYIHVNRLGCQLILNRQHERKGYKRMEQFSKGCNYFANLFRLYLHKGYHSANL